MHTSRLLSGWFVVLVATFVNLRRAFVVRTFILFERRRGWRSARWRRRQCRHILRWEALFGRLVRLSLLVLLNRKLWRRRLRARPFLVAHLVGMFGAFCPGGHLGRSGCLIGSFTVGEETATDTAFQTLTSFIWLYPADTPIQSVKTLHVGGIRARGNWGFTCNEYLAVFVLTLDSRCHQF